MLFPDVSNNCHSVRRAGRLPSGTPRWIIQWIVQRPEATPEDGPCCRDPFRCPSRVIDADSGPYSHPSPAEPGIRYRPSKPSHIHRMPTAATASSRPHVATVHLLMRPLPDRARTDTWIMEFSLPRHSFYFAMWRKVLR